MKLFIKLLLFIVVLGVSGLFVLKRPDGQPWLDASEFMPDLSAAQRLVGHVKNWFNSFVEDPAEPEPFGQTKVYRWQDQDGRWQLSDTPPQGQDAEVTYINPDRNMIQGLRAQPAPQPQNPDASELPSGLPLPLTISPKQVKKLMKDAQQVQETLNQRNRDLEAIANGEQPDDR